MPESDTTYPTSRFAVAIGLALSSLAIVIVAGCGSGTQGHAYIVTPAMPPAALAQVSPAPRPQSSQATVPVPATPLQAGPAVTLPMPTVRAQGTLVPAATVAAPSADEIARGPHLALESTEFDFGKVSPTQVLTHTFMFTNTGKSDLIIQQITST